MPPMTTMPAMTSMTTMARVTTMAHCWRGGRILGRIHHRTGMAASCPHGIVCAAPIRLLVEDGSAVGNKG